MPSGIDASKFRIEPKAWKGEIAMSLELLGCRVEKLEKTTTGTKSNAVVVTTTQSIMVWYWMYRNTG